MQNLLNGKTALVTGAGQGVGQGIALALAEAGARVALVGRTRASLEGTRAQIQARGGEALVVPCDVTDGAAILHCVDKVVAAYGSLQILVNNAQIVPLGRILEVSDEAFRQGLDSGPLATLRLMRACYPYLKGDGAVVNLASSAAVRWDASGYGHYAATKEAIRALSRAAACEWGVDGIRVNVIAPHALSPGLRGWMEDNPEEARDFCASIPLRRVGDCEQDIGRAVVFLVGEQAGYLTGATLPLDGGQAYWG
ncbi:Short-chain alcohol dehydrogenase like protein [Pseudomonas sp. 8AS]|uniref:SDR family NAD(P)-dependent oxidoreductase n=1 Tax=Pseudomonas sp. 8AS TaxID=2653163 RepID=UPI0012F12E01|nr:SDR family NAD(P)-dependent oxidoreductase [Pseudomonas sp. 8AS]VXC10392.1 Short-chain alcohol dehydrogenase like protein [Pseudomonas sp. 8AS]